MAEIENLYPKLSVTPIKEIIVAVTYSGSMTLEEINSIGENSELLEDLPIKNLAYNANVQVSATNPQKPESSVKAKIDGAVFQNNEKSRILQLRLGSLSYHVINEYVPFDKVISKIGAYWGEISQVGNSIKVLNVSVRYLNFIETDLNVQDVAKIFVSHPFSKDSDSMSNIKFRDQDKAVNITTIRGILDGKSGVVLDYTITKAIDDKDRVIDGLNDLHGFKNKIFFSSLKEEVIEKYK